MSRNSTSTHPQMPPTQLEPDETRVLGECERESLIYRSIPMGLVTFFATQYAMSRNIISTKAKWIKLGAGLFAGYIIGKVSYAPACRKKILTQIPDSNLARAIRGIDTRQANDEDDQRQFPQQYRSKDPNEAIVAIPLPNDQDIHTVPVGVNQYGDPIYETHK